MRAVNLLFNANVLDLNLHRQPDVTLNSKQAFQFAADCVVIHHHAHHVTIENLNQRVASGNQVQGVPIVGFDQCINSALSPSDATLADFLPSPI